MCVNEEEMGLFSCTAPTICMMWLFPVAQQEMWFLVSDWSATPGLQDTTPNATAVATSADCNFCFDRSLRQKVSCGLQTFRDATLIRSDYI